MRRLLLTLVLISMTAPVYPEAWDSGVELLELCEDTESSAKQTACMAYIAGVLDTASVFRSNGLTDLFGEEETIAIVRDQIDDSQERLFEFYVKHAKWNFQNCRPRVTMGQIRRIVTKYLQSHPERLHESGGLLVLDAMTNAFPFEAVHDELGDIVECPNRVDN
jgi:hypothetical protein